MSHRPDLRLMGMDAMMIRQSPPADDVAGAHRRLARRLRPLQVAMVLEGMALWVPVEKLFMSEIGFDPAGVGVMAAAYAALVPILELPSGILADRWSRRGVLIVASLAALCSVLIGGFSHNVPTYILSAVVLGVFFAMHSGTLDSVVYDTVLEEMGESGAFEERIGRIRLANSVALVASALAGGWLASVTSPRATYFLTVPFVAASIVALRFFDEPQLHKSQKSSSLRSHIATTYATLLEGGRLLPVVTLMVLGSVLLQLLFEFGPLWLLVLAASAALYGPATAGLVSALGLGGMFAGRVCLERPATACSIAGVMTGCGLVLVTSRTTLVVIAAQVVLAVLLVAAGIFLTRLLHDAVPSTVRAGVASGVGALSWVAFLPVALLFGVVSDEHGVFTAGWMLAALTGLSGVLLVKVAVGRATGSPAPEAATLAVAGS